jgi:hypothetical protein
MPPPRLRIAPLQFGAGAVEEQHADVEAMRVAQRADAFDDPRRVEIARACADADRQRLAVVRRPHGERRIEQPVEQHQRQIVDHLPAEVLERLEHRRLARAGQAGDEQYVLGHGTNLIPVSPRAGAAPIRS